MFNVDQKHILPIQTQKRQSIFDNRHTMARLPKYFGEKSYKFYTV